MRPFLAKGKWVLLEIDVEGAMAVFEKRPDAITILICPESVEQLGERLRKRGTETEEVINKTVPPELVDRIKAFLSDKLRQAHNPFKN